jgi:hypothetical protein
MSVFFGRQSATIGGQRPASESCGAWCRNCNCGVQLCRTHSVRFSQRGRLSAAALLHSPPGAGVKPPQMCGRSGEHGRAELVVPSGLSALSPVCVASLAAHRPQHWLHSGAPAYGREPPARSHGPAKALTLALASFMAVHCDWPAALFCVVTCRLVSLHGGRGMLVPLARAALPALVGGVRLVEHADRNLSRSFHFTPETLC